jgi:excisionase family DNA binding protein
MGDELLNRLLEFSKLSLDEAMKQGAKPDQTAKLEGLQLADASPAPTTEELDVYLTVKELARLLRCHERHARRLLDEGLFRAFRLNGPNSKILISRQSAQRYIDRQILQFQIDGGYSE